MRLAYHPQVQREVNRILQHYNRIAVRLGDEFWDELMRLIELFSAIRKGSTLRIADCVGLT